MNNIHDNECELISDIERIIADIPDPSAVQKLIANAREMEAEIERLRGLLREALRIDAGDFSVNVDEWLLRVREALGKQDV